MSALLNLNNDALRAVLVRTCGSDHLNLCLTCSRIRDIIHSPEFRQERCETETAEISVKILSPFQLYQEQMGPSEDTNETDDWFQERYNDFGGRDPNYGYQDNRARIYVDGKLAGRTSFTLLPRDDPRVNFHDMADSISQEIQETGCAFFDARGRPRVESVKQALKNDDEKTAFLYINAFDFLAPEYQTTTTTGARALRILLTDTSLKDKWSVAAYIPDARSQFNPNDRETESAMSFRQREHFMARMMQDSDVSDTESELNWQERRKDLNNLDMRHFFRAGFQQAKELVMDHNCAFVFAVRSFLQQPMISHEEAMTIEIAEKPKPQHEPTKEEKKMLKIMKRFCTQRREIDNARRQLQRPREEQAIYRYAQEKLAEAQRETQRAVDTANEEISTAENSRQVFTALLSASNAEETRHAMVLAAPGLNGDDIPQEAIEQQLARLQDENARQEMQQCLDSTNDLLSRMRRVLDTTLPNAVRQRQELERRLNVQIDEAIEEQRENNRQEARDLDARVRLQVSELVEKAGSDIIQNSDALQACACNLQPNYIELLLSFVPDAKKVSAMNSLDSHGETPLRIAALSGACSSLCPETRLQTCQKIIELGGDKNLTDSNGLTALGKFRKADRCQRDFWGSCGVLNLTNPNYRAQVESAPALEELLRPVLGPTAADEAILDEGSESESDFDDEDGEGEEVEESDEDGG